MKKETTNHLTPAHQAELDALAAMPDEEINTEDAPELSDWSEAKRGIFYRPVKQQITLRLDADIIAWFKATTSRGRGYQTQINRALREYVTQQVTRRRAVKK